MKLLVLAFIIPLALGLTFQEDDLVFDDVSDDSQPISSVSPLINQPSEPHQPQPPQSQSHPSTGSKIIESTSQSPFPEANVTTTVGHVFRFKVPKHAFGGSVNHYEIRSSNNKPLPHWLFYDEATTTLLGVPAKKDVGQHHLSIKAYYTYGDVVESLFTVKVLPEKTDEHGITAKKDIKNDVIYVHISRRILLTFQSDRTNITILFYNVYVDVRGEENQIFKKAEGILYGTGYR
ncbi:Protein of unknown function [Cotesia congregata]|uniref:Dystroglycan-type cadherin-like domain-containing protein n=1 Tax=Cotesia congregata TaxID=51543 RepID=A0A8J2ECS4_COTCN|nr:Protein of unknown function [Cotesia congregata]